MENNLEKLIKKLYKSYKSEKKDFVFHPSEEDLACFLEDKLSEGEAKEIKQHIIECEECANKLATRIKLDQDLEEVEIPSALIERAKKIIEERLGYFSDIILKIKGEVLELIHTQIDVLLGNELLPVPLLRSRRIKDFDNEIYFFKEIAELRAEIKIEAKPKNLFSIDMILKSKKTNEAVKDLRISLYRDDIELESYMSSLGKVSFDNLPVGIYRIEISSLDKRIASIVLEVRI